MDSKNILLTPFQVHKLLREVYSTVLEKRKRNLQYFLNSQPQEYKQSCFINAQTQWLNVVPLSCKSVNGHPYHQAFSAAIKTIWMFHPAPRKNPRASSREKQYLSEVSHSRITFSIWVHKNAEKRIYQLNFFEELCTRYFML